MNQLLLFFTLLVFTTPSLMAESKTWNSEPGFSFQYNPDNCGKPDIFAEPFHKGLFFPDGDLIKDRGLSRLFSIEELKEAAERTYSSDRRLLQRVFLEPSTQKFKGDVNYLFSPKNHNYDLRPLPSKTIASVLANLKDSLESGFGKFITYIDMGHLHMQIPVEVLEGFKREIKDKDQRNQLMMQHPEVKFLYHTAEKIHLLDEHNNNTPFSKEHGWWYLNRNVIGSFMGERSVYTVIDESKGYNTYGDLPGYKEFGPSLYFEANKDGCFQLEYNGENINLDFTFKMPPSDPEVLAASPDK